MTGEAARKEDWAPASVYVLGFLYLIATFNYLDRLLLGLALPAIKQEMQVSDTALGLVTGLAFTLSYSLLGIPIAWAADRFSRRNIIAIGFAFWSLMTVFSGLAANIWQLSLARFLMGVGESTGMAPSTSMISDLFRARSRQMAMSILGTAGVVASLTFFPVVGAVGQAYGWRAMFFVAGVPGVALALLFALTVREPARGGKEAIVEKAPSPTLGETVRFLAGSRAYILLTLGATFMGASLSAEGSWLATFLHRVHGAGIRDAAFLIGPVRGGAGALGILSIGYLIHRLSGDRPKMRARIPAIACILTGPAQALYLLSDPPWLWLTGFLISGFLVLVYWGPVFALGVSVVRLPMRALATAITLAVSTMLGQIAGPLIVGALNDALAPRFGELAVRYSMLPGALTSMLAGVMFWLAGEMLQVDSARANSALQVTSA
ncbi:MAG: MFS transporter [Alphaproteobacteria bacterium]